MSQQVRINWIGFKTLYFKEVWRFLKVYNQTLLAPMVTALLFLAVFSLAIGERVRNIGDIPFKEFMAAGLIMMVMVQNAFANTSSSLMMGKVIGYITDILMPPLTPLETTAAMVFAGITRGLMCGVLVAIAVSFFVPFSVYDFPMVIIYAVLACSMLALVGMLAGVFADSFDQMHAINSYIITPLAFLSGTFYSVRSLPEFWQVINDFNPFFYMINGFRYSITGHTDTNIYLGIWILIISNILLYWLVQTLMNRGTRIKN